MQQLTIVGNLTRDPELKYTPNGQPLVSFGVAENRRYQQDGEWREETTFFDCTAWRDLAENIAQSWSVGDRVIIVGRLKLHSWETPEGDTRRKLEVDVTDCGASLMWAYGALNKTPKPDSDSDESNVVELETSKK